MKEWINKKANSKILEVPKKGYDWGIHNPDGMGLPGMNRTDTKATPAQAPRSGAGATGEATTNFTPGRAAGY
jgi:hypothetical protein